MASLKRKVVAAEQAAEDRARREAALFHEISLQLRQCQEELNLEHQKLEQANHELISENDKLVKALRRRELYVMVMCPDGMLTRVFWRRMAKGAEIMRVEEATKLQEARQQEIGLRVQLTQCREEWFKELSRRQLLEKTVAQLIASKNSLKTALDDLNT